MSSGAPTQEATNNTPDSPNPRPKPSKLGQNKNNQQLQKQQAPVSDDEDDLEDKPELAPKRAGGRRMVPVHQSRIADRPAKVGEKDSSLKIKIELDLEVEVEIYARVKGDVTIGLM
ncbi:hypothetical protein D6D19_03024 [Aureobasidium pullulans]|uniref:Uncharacterized protein n=2 Tax=Aureobasidium pullulans TaxID=5580 RepID=A0A074XKN5_AURPU|nr:uncharacterized protein M438DRAFT_364222 [Aureobasidium pullulans EXF-150]KAG2164236.1 hypothetical protein JADG_003975 [Aureobasidium pullulans]KAG2164237.1 hypothetical protein JADG_003976 [Aureobasidium pullulans]KEQ86063.1 hypothetical protein M438DRAFT_364222 [Aureobasidium pullulans EXF-150]THV70176.1 hypothetical protein D6D28_05337 [Aureobasidium pullulans]THV82519.1 hypothetical protein D6D27_08378 [Aureobasidium pullulans]